MSCCHSQRHLYTVNSELLTGLGEVWRDDVVEQLLHYTLQILLFIYSLVHKVYHLLIALWLPYPVASHQQEVIIRAELLDKGIWEGSDGLLLRFQVFVGFIFQITQRPTQIQVAVHSSLCNGTASFLYPPLLSLVIRFVVEWKSNGFSRSSKDTSRISCICYVYLLTVINDYHICGTTYWV